MTTLARLIPLFDAFDPPLGHWIGRSVPQTARSRARERHGARAAATAGSDPGFVARSYDRLSVPAEEIARARLRPSG